MFPVKKILLATAIFSIAPSAIALNEDGAFMSGELLAPHIIDCLVRRIKNSRSDGLNFEELLRDAQYLATFYQETASFARGVVCGLRTIQIEKVVESENLTRQKHAGVLVGYYVYIDCFGFMEKHPRNFKNLSPADKITLQSSAVSSLKRVIKEVFGVDSKEYKQAVDSIKMQGFDKALAQNK